MNLTNLISKIWTDNKIIFEHKLDTWIKSFEDSREALALIKKQFHQWASLRVYVSTSKAKARIFSLRFLGQEVAQLIPRNDKILIKLSGHSKKNKEWFSGFEFLDGEYDWRSKQGAEFRAYFKRISESSLSPIKIKSPEHRVESKFIVEMLKGSNKFGINGLKIRPVTIGGMPLQIPVPISASRNEPNVGNGYIDILSRHKGADNKDRLCLWELKKPDTYGHPASQVYIYAATLLKILRYSKDAARWYQLFGFKRQIPSTLEIEAVVAISPSKREDFKKEMSRLMGNSSFQIGNDKVRIYAAYYIEQPNSSRIIFESDPFIREQ